MSAPVVAIKRVERPGPQSLEETVARCLELCPLPAGALGSRALIKINAMSQEVFPGRNTGPWFLEAVLTVLRREFPGVELIVADTDVAGRPQFERACHNWGYDRIAQRLGLRLVNLAKEPTTFLDTGDEYLPRLELPRLVTEVDAIVNLPVLKTHVLTGLTCCLKNHWGLMPRLRYQHHGRVNQVIALINRMTPQTVCNLVDATVCIEGPGPKTGRPKVCSLVMAGRDRVATDAAAAEITGLGRDAVPAIAVAQAVGVGSADHVRAGDPVGTLDFAPPAVSGDLVSALEGKIRCIPVVGKICYHPRVAPLLGLVGTAYNEVIWQWRVGRKLVAEVMARDDYGPEFRSLMGGHRLRPH